MSPVPARRPASCIDFVKLLPAPAPVATEVVTVTPAPRRVRERRAAARQVCGVATRCAVDTDLFGGGFGEF
jgi:hypothetical protein